jgi:hypothetical protein
MKTLMILTAAAVTALIGLPAVSQAQVADAISLTNQAIVELTDFPANGLRYTVDLNKLDGGDVRQTKKAAGLLQDALGKARSGNASARAIHLLEMAERYASYSEHKEGRLSAQGALYHLCQGASGPGCDTVPKFGSYVAP